MRVMKSNENKGRAMICMSEVGQVGVNLSSA